MQDQVEREAEQKGSAGVRPEYVQTKQDQLQSVFNALVDVALKLSEQKNSPVHLNLLPAVVDKIIDLQKFID